MEFNCALIKASEKNALLLRKPISCAVIYSISRQLYLICHESAAFDSALQKQNYDWRKMDWVARIQHNYLKETDLQFHFFLERHRGKLDKEFKENRGRLRHSHKREDQGLINVKKEKKKEKKRRPKTLGIIQVDLTLWTARNCQSHPWKGVSVWKNMATEEVVWRKIVISKTNRDVHGVSNYRRRAIFFLLTTKTRVVLGKDRKMCRRRRVNTAVFTTQMCPRPDVDTAFLRYNGPWTHRAVATAANWPFWGQWCGSFIA